jgi:hypothetical protein
LIFLPVLGDGHVGKTDLGGKTQVRTQFRRVGRWIEGERDEERRGYFTFHSTPFLRAQLARARGVPSSSSRGSTRNASPSPHINENQRQARREFVCVKEREGERGREGGAELEEEMHTLRLCFILRFNLAKLRVKGQEQKRKEKRDKIGN